MTGWKCSVYAYAGGNPVSHVDPLGLYALITQNGTDGLTGGITPAEAQGLSIQQMANNVVQALSVAFGFSIEGSSVNPVTSGGGGAKGYNLEYTSDEGWQLYAVNPNDAPSEGFLLGPSFTGNLAVGTGSWTGPFDNVAASYGPGMFGVTAGYFYSSSPVGGPDYPGYFGVTLGISGGPPGAGQYQTTYDYFTGPPGVGKPCP